jgi:GTP-binding protein
MDYARNNYIAQPGDLERGVKMTPPEIGVYDIYAIHWGYQLIKGADTPEAEKPTLDKWIAEKAGDPMYAFGAQQLFSTIDPTAQTEDLGNDHVKASNYGISNLKIVMQNLEAWTLEKGERYDQVEKHKVKQLMVFDGLGKASVDTVRCGDICAVVGIDGFEIGDTIADLENPEALPPISIDEPTMSMLFTINNSPFFGRDGKFVTSRHIKDRLEKELEKNLALRVKPGQNADSFIVYGRGVLHLSVLIEEMRREGFELQVGQPKVLDKTINGQRCEPIEDLSIEVPEQFVGAAIDLSTRRKGALIHMEPRGDRTLLQFDIPTRGLMGLRSNLLTATQGEAIMAHRYKEYQPYKGEIDNRTNGSLVSLETGDAIAYSMNKLLDRGKFFVDPGEEIYCGEVVGEHTRERDLNINICKTKKLTNVRAAGSDEKIVLPPPVKMSLEEMLEYIREDELVEVTPHHMRIRKILLDPMDRKRSGNGGDDE